MLGKAIRNVGLRREDVVISVIVGAKRVEQPGHHLAAVNVALTTEQLASLDGASTLAPGYPGWMIERQAHYRALSPPSADATPDGTVPRRRPGPSGSHGR